MPASAPLAPPALARRPGLPLSRTACLRILRLLLRRRSGLRRLSMRRGQAPFAALMAMLFVAAPAGRVLAQGRVSTAPVNSLQSLQPTDDTLSQDQSNVSFIDSALP